MTWDLPACGEVDANQPQALVDYLLEDRLSPVDEAALSAKIEAFRGRLGV